MTDAAEVVIETVLLVRARAFAAVRSLGLSEPNKEFQVPVPAPTVMYLRASFIPAPSFAIGISYTAFQQHYGIFQLDVFRGIKGDEIESRRVAAAAAAYFKRGTELVRDGFTTTIYEAPQIAQGFPDGAWWMVPVRLPYRCYARPTA